MKAFLSRAVSKFHLSWLKDGRPVLKLPRIRVTEFSPAATSSGDESAVAEAALFVDNVQKEDSGAYQCVVGIERDGGNGVSETQASAELRLGGMKDQLGTSKKASFTRNGIQFADASPRLHYTFIDQTLQPGPLVSLKCSASGNPTPNIKWMLDGFQLPNSER